MECTRADLCCTEFQWGSSHEESACVCDSLTATTALCLPWCQQIPWPKLLSQTYFLLPSSFLFPSFSFLYVCFWWTKEKNIFPGNLLYLQSSDMAARPLLINSPLNFNRLIINYWGINVQIQLCCPSSVHKCQQRYFMAYTVEHSDSQSPLTLTSQLSEAEKRGFLNWVCRQNEREEEIWAKE